VIDDATRTDSAPIWRLISDRPDPARWLAKGRGRQIGEPVWSSEFHISHRINSRLQLDDAVFFAGDAAHIHSPIGARGMNLGIEDAWVFAQLINAGRADEYERSRRPVVENVVRQVELLSRMARGESVPARLMRSVFFGWLVKLSPVRERMLETLTGLDHPLAFGLPQKEYADIPAPDDSTWRESRPVDV
jgi:2-polyprenyl-6-methoxyphenol hydroxylase-like FAD-dependent oxidoreductase